MLTLKEAERAQSVYPMAVGWTPGFDSRQVKKFSLLHSIQTSHEAHPVSCPMGIGSYFPGVKRPGCETDHHLQLVPKSRLVELYLHSLIRLYLRRA
jgi:hypothetical protein